jgi:hypothetical protein
MPRSLRHDIDPLKPSFGLSDMDDPDPIKIPIDGTLDLHTFRADGVKDLVAEYLRACLVGGILQVRIIHGKGSGTLRETVHSVLRRMPEVASFALAGEDAGGWGATIVVLREFDTAPILQRHWELRIHRLQFAT